MKVTLVDHNSMWFLEGGRYHLNGDNPGPIDIDWDSLSVQDKRSILISARWNKIRIDGDLEVLITSYNAANAVKAPLAVVVETEKVAVFPDPVEELEKMKSSLTTLLGKGIATIRKELGLMTEIRKIKLMLELENTGKQRKNIIELIESKLSAINESIQKNIESQQGPAFNADGMDTLANSMKIVEDIEVDKKIIINIV